MNYEMLEQTIYKYIEFRCLKIFIKLWFLKSFNNKSLMNYIKEKAANQITSRIIILYNLIPLIYNISSPYTFYFFICICQFLKKRLTD